jgi:hypothetical protein
MTDISLEFIAEHLEHADLHLLLLTMIFWAIVGQQSPRDTYTWRQWREDRKEWKRLHPPSPQSEKLRFFIVCSIIATLLILFFWNHK